MKRVLITGGAGFIGSNLVAYLNRISPETEVVVVDDLSTGHLENVANLSCEFISASVLDYESLRLAAHGVESIIHLAALGSVPRSVAHPRATHDANASGTLNVLEVAREIGVGHVTVASSSSVYGANPSMPKNEFDWTRPVSPYAVSKLATEAYALAYQANYKIKTLALRFFNVYGPKQRADHHYAAVIPRFIDAAINGKPVTIYGDGKHSRDFTFVETVCSALYSSSLNKIHHEHPVNLAFGKSTTLIELAGTIGAVLGKEIETIHQPERIGDVRNSQADPSSLRLILPHLRPTSLESGIKETIAWFLESKTGLR